MTPSSRNRISVDLCGLKASLFEQACARGVSPSGLVRDALIGALGRIEPSSSDHVAAGAPFPPVSWLRIGPMSCFGLCLSDVVCCMRRPSARK